MPLASLAAPLLAQAEKIEPSRHHLLEIIPLLIVLALGVALFIYIAAIKMKLNRRRPGEPRQAESTQKNDSPPK